MQPQQTSRPDLASNSSQAENASLPSVAPRRIRIASFGPSSLSTSWSRNPIRSFTHQTYTACTDTPHYASQGVRERSNQLASYALDPDHYRTHTSAVASPPPLPSSSRKQHHGSTAQTDSLAIGQHVANAASPPLSSTERTPLLPVSNHYSHTPSQPAPNLIKNSLSSPFTLPSSSLTRKRAWARTRSIIQPKNFTVPALIAAALGSVQVASAVLLGLLLNLLDALSYGYILFPLGTSVFSQTGPDGISIFFVSCIVSQLCYSLGLSAFKGGVGSQMIEVVPFFHNMAYSIMRRMQGQPPEAIIATTIVSYCLSSILTGFIFLALGAFQLGNLVSFFPRHILIGCIGGVGFFLIVTGIEVSVRLDGNLRYDWETLQKLLSADTWYLWIIPLSLAIFIIILSGVVRRPAITPYILPASFVAVFATFYIIVKPILHKELNHLRDAGWIFEQPETGVKFYRFYSYFKFGCIDTAALVSTIPTMFALSFFGIMHVPINVPALGAARQQDDLNVNRELIAHGISNTVSGLLGSIQNYLVYSNSIMFIDNGGDSRVAGVCLAMVTLAIWVAGPALIGFIPVCLVGALIFLLGIDLMKQALWAPFGKCHKLEYSTILAIVLIMGVYDFVIGILVGIVLACVSYVVQSSRRPAIRASYSGIVAESTVRRPPADRRYLNKVRAQIRVIKLGGFLFFGTIAAVEQHMRSLIDDDQFQKQPISSILVDLAHVTDVDFSSSEGFQRINRILHRKNVKMVLSGVSFTSRVGRALQNVGLLDLPQEDEACPPPRVFEDLNTALEASENELLEEFYMHCHAFTLHSPVHTPPWTAGDASVASSEWSIESNKPTSSFHVDPFDPIHASPRRDARLTAARSTVHEAGDIPPVPLDSCWNDTAQPDSLILSRWRRLAQPLKIILQAFEDLSPKNEDFWHILTLYVERKTYVSGAILYSRGDESNGFYILEKGRLRAEHELDQGSFAEVILPGTTCGELPFFSETDRTGTVAVEKDSIAWLLTRKRFEELEKEHPEVGRELLKVGLKLAKERMDAVTSYVLVTASR